jgi:hypothetical protein
MSGRENKAPIRWHYDEILTGRNQGLPEQHQDPSFVSHLPPHLLRQALIVRAVSLTEGVLGPGRPMIRSFTLGRPG